MKKIFFLMCFFVAGSANATLLFTNVSYTSNSVTFTVDGDMTGYATPSSDDQLTLIYGGDIWSAGIIGFLPNTWSQPVFDNKSFSNSGFTGTSSLINYSWSRYSSNLNDATVNLATVTLSMSNSPLDINALNPIISFAWGNGAQSNTLLQTVEINNQNTASPIPEPTSLALLGLGLAGFGFSKKRLKK